MATLKTTYMLEKAIFTHSLQQPFDIHGSKPEYIQWSALCSTTTVKAISMEGKVFGSAHDCDSHSQESEGLGVESGRMSVWYERSLYNNQVIPKYTCQAYISYMSIHNLTKQVFTFVHIYSFHQSPHEVACLNSISHETGI